MPKSPDAFRTISEVADWLGIQAHVLRFWESKFTQVKPIKRAGGRRYYRPNDMLLLGGIRQLLHEDGLTIKGVQKILREEGMNHVASLSQPLDELTQSQMDDGVSAQYAEPDIEVPEPAQETGVVLNFENRQAETAPAEPEPAPAPPEDPAPETPEAAAPDAPTETPTGTEASPAPQEQSPDAEEAEPQMAQAPIVEPEPEAQEEPVAGDVSLSEQEIEAPAPDPHEQAPVEAEPAGTEPAHTDPMPDDAAQAEAASEDPAPDAAEPGHRDPDPASLEDDGEDSFLATFEHASDPDASADPAPADIPRDTGTVEEAEPAAAALPAFLRRPMAEPEAPSDNTPAPVEAEEAAEPAPPAPRPRDIGMPEITPPDQISAAPAVLSHAFRTRSLTTAQAREIAPLLDRLTILRDSMAARRRGGTPPGPNA